jgi:NADPH-dependent curcumin reductase CurA
MIDDFTDVERDSYLATENARLKRELAEPKEELGILKKTAVGSVRAEKLDSAISQSCPNGIDIVFDKVRRVFLDSANQLLNNFARTLTAN